MTTATDNALDLARALGAKAARRWYSYCGAPCLPTCLDQQDREAVTAAGGNCWASDVVEAYMRGWATHKVHR